MVVTSRDSDRVSEAVSLLQRESSNEREFPCVWGTTADVGKSNSVAALANFAREQMGGVDLWINNAGANGYSYTNLVDSDPAVLKEVVETNSLGTLLCCREAIQMMSNQPSGGHVFNLLGAGSDGGATLKYAAYGHTKAGLVQLTKTLAKEVEGTGVGVHAISPGMVFTELISSGRDAFGAQGRFFVNTMAEPPEVAAEEIVDKVRTFVLETREKDVGVFGSLPLRLPFGKGVIKSTTFEVLTPPVALSKMFRRLIFGEGKDRYYIEDD